MEQPLLTVYNDVHVMGSYGYTYVCCTYVKIVTYVLQTLL